MIITHTHRFIYLGPPRTGSTSLTNFFKEHYGGEHFYRPEYDWAPHRFQTLSGKAQHQLILPVEYSDYLTVLSVRNPYTRFLSMYTFFKTRYQVSTVESYFRHAEPPITEELDRQFPGCAPMRIDCIVRLESLEADVNALPFIKTRVQIPHERKTDATSLPLTLSVIDFVNRFYRSDFAAFGYPKKTKFLGLLSGLKVSILNKMKTN